MRQLDRISKLYRQLDSSHQRQPLPLKTLQERLDHASPATVKRDIAFLRDSLLMPVVYDRETNGYYIEKNPNGVPTSYSVPGLWINGHEAYAFLTLYNVLSHIDPGVLKPLIEPLRGVLKQVLCDTGTRVFGFHQKIKVELDIPVSGRAALPDISYALARDETVLLKFTEGSSLINGEYLPLCLTLRPGSWVLTAALDSNKSEPLEIPVDQIESCAVARPDEEYVSKKAFEKQCRSFCS